MHICCLYLLYRKLEFFNLSEKKVELLTLSHHQYTGMKIEMILIIFVSVFEYFARFYFFVSELVMSRSRKPILVPKLTLIQNLHNFTFYSRFLADIIYKYFRIFLFRNNIFN